GAADRGCRLPGDRPVAGGLGYRGARAERGSVGAGAGGEARCEVLTHGDLAAEAGPAGDLGHGEVGAFEEALGCGDALVEEPAQRRGAGGRGEAAGEGAW